MHLYSLTQIVMASHHQVVVLQRQGFTFAVKSEEMSTSKETLMQNKGKVNDDEVNSKQFWYLRSHPCGGKESGSCIVPGLWYLFVFGKYYRISLVVHWQSRSTSWVRLLMLAPTESPSGGLSPPAAHFLGFKSCKQMIKCIKTHLGPVKSLLSLADLICSSSRLRLDCRSRPTGFRWTHPDDSTMSSSKEEKGTDFYLTAKVNPGESTNVHNNTVHCVYINTISYSRGSLVFFSISLGVLGLKNLRDPCVRLCSSF